MASRGFQQTDVEHHGVIEEDAEMAPELSFYHGDQVVSSSTIQYRAQEQQCLGPRIDALKPANPSSNQPWEKSRYDGDAACGGGHQCQAVAPNVPSQICPSSSAQKYGETPEFDKHELGAEAHQYRRTGPGCHFSQPKQPSGQTNMITEEDVPLELKTGQYDVLLVYADQDKADALKLKQLLERFVDFENKRVRICVIDQDLQWISSQFDQMDEAMKRTTYVFLYVTKTFCNDNWASMQKDNVLMTSITDPDKRWCVVPLFIDGKRNPGYTFPFGIRGFKGIDVFHLLGRRPIAEIKIDELTNKDLDSFILGNIREMLKCRLNHRREREREDARKLKDWKKKECWRRQEEHRHLQEEETRLREEEACLMRRRAVQPALPGPEGTAWQSHSQPAEKLTEEPKRSSIVYNISHVENLQIGNNNQIQLDGGSASHYDPDIDVDEEPCNTAPPTTCNASSPQPPVGDITVISSGVLTSSGERMVVTQSDGAPGDMNSSTEDTNVKHAVGEPSRQHPMGSSRGEENRRQAMGSSWNDETEILKPVRADNVGGAAVVQFGIDVRSSADEDEDDNVVLMKPADRGLGHVGNSMPDDDTDLLKPVRLIGPAGDRSANGQSARTCGARFGQLECDGPSNNDTDGRLGATPTGGTTCPIPSSATCPAELCRKANPDCQDTARQSKPSVLNKIKSFFL